MQEVFDFIDAYYKITAVSYLIDGINMAVFLVTSDQPAVGERLVGDGIEVKKLFDSAWLVSDNASTLPKELSDKLRLAEGDQGSLLVTRVDAYWGWHDNDVWSWLQERGIA